VAREKAVAIEQRVIFCVGLDVVSRRVRSHSTNWP
jgi:hypothetical protein